MRIAITQAHGGAHHAYVHAYPAATGVQSMQNAPMPQMIFNPYTTPYVHPFATQHGQHSGFYFQYPSPTMSNAGMPAHNHHMQAPMGMSSGSAMHAPMPVMLGDNKMDRNSSDSSTGTTSIGLHGPGPQ